MVDKRVVRRPSKRDVAVGAGAAVVACAWSWWAAGPRGTARPLDLGAVALVCAAAGALAWRQVAPLAAALAAAGGYLLAVFPCGPVLPCVCWAMFEVGRGASGFVLKDADPGDLVRVVRAAAGGDALLSPSVTHRLVDRFGRPHDNAGAAPTGMETLTARDRDVVAWVATGRSNDEIAAELLLSQATVRTHVGRAMLKLHTRDRAQLVVFAVRAGLMPGG